MNSLQYPIIEVNQLFTLPKPNSFTFLNQKMLLLCDHSKINSILKRSKMYKANMLCAFNTIQEILLDMPLLCDSNEIQDKRIKANMVYYKSKKVIFTLQGFVKKILITLTTTNKFSHQHALNLILYNICCFMKTASDYFVQFSKQLKISLIESKPEIIEKIILYVKDFINFENFIYERCEIENNDLLEALEKIISQIIFTLNNKFFMSADLITKPVNENKNKNEKPISKVKNKKKKIVDTHTKYNRQLEKKIQTLAIATLGLPKGSNLQPEKNEKSKEGIRLEISSRDQGTSIQEDQLTARSSRISQKSVYDYSIKKPSTPVEIGDYDNGILIILPPSKNNIELDWNDNEDRMHLTDSPPIVKINEENDERYFNSNNENSDITPSESSLKNEMIESNKGQKEKQPKDEYFQKEDLLQLPEETNTKIQSNNFILKNNVESTKQNKNVLEQTADDHCEEKKSYLKGIVHKELPYTYKKAHKLLGTIDIHSQSLAVDELWSDETIKKFIQLKIPFWNNQLQSPFSEFNKNFTEQNSNYKSNTESNWNSNWLLKEAYRRRRRGEGVWSDWMIQCVLDEAVPEWRLQANNSDSLLHILLRNYHYSLPTNRVLNTIPEQDLLKSMKNSKKKKISDDLELADLFEGFTIKCVIEAIYKATKDLPSENKNKILNKLKINK